jgi:Tol biopolymer transport system component
LVGGQLVNAAEPKLSPDGARIAFTCGTELWNVCVMDADGGDVRVLSDLRGDTQPAWSPDGKKIAFTSLREGEPHVYVMNADGSDHQRLAVNDPALISESTPAWSPDGTRIAFVGGTEASQDIYVADAGGSGATARVTFAEGLKNSPAWSPDGNSIVYDSYEAIRAVNVASGVITTLATGDETQRPSYSPDGSRIAFYRKTLIRDEEGTVIGKEDGIYVMNADGTNEASLNAAGGYAPHWGSVQSAPPPARTPAERVADLISLVRSFNLPYGTANSLTVKLRAALDALEAGDTATACARLSDFVNHTRAQSGKKLTAAQANQLIEEATSIRALLGCP